MIKNIIFDIGGIFFDWGKEPLIKLLNKSEDEVNQIYKLVYGDRRFKECVLGNLSQSEYMEQLIKENEEYADGIEKILSEKYQEESMPVIKKNIEEIYELKRKGYKIYFLSNMTDISYKYVENKLGVTSVIDGGVYSFQEHIKKPSQEIFDVLMKRYDLKKDESIFFDDTPRNVDAGNEYGIKSYVFRTMEDVRGIKL